MLSYMTREIEDISQQTAWLVVDSKLKLSHDFFLLFFGFSIPSLSLTLPQRRRRRRETIKMKSKNISSQINFSFLYVMPRARKMNEREGSHSNYFIFFFSWRHKLFDQFWGAFERSDNDNETNSLIKIIRKCLREKKKKIMMQIHCSFDQVPAIALTRVTSLSLSLLRLSYSLAHFRHTFFFLLKISILNCVWIYTKHVTCELSPPHNFSAILGDKFSTHYLQAGRYFSFALFNNLFTRKSIISVESDLIFTRWG